MAPAPPVERTNEFWIERARSTRGLVSVHTRSRSQRYDAWSRHLLQAWTLDRVRSLAPGYRRCVDIGCGHGDWTELLATVADEVFACDVAPSFVDATRSRVPRASVVCSDLRRYEVPPRIDLAYLGAVLMYLSDRDASELLVRLRRSVTDDAVVVVRDWCTFNLGRRTERPDPRYYSLHRRPRELRALAANAGFTCTELVASPRIYAEVIAKHRPLLRWPLRFLARVATVHWLRASHTLVLRPTIAGLVPVISHEATRT